MKKLLIGCGAVLLLCLGVMGVVMWQIWPAIESAAAEAEDYHQRLVDLEVNYPFDPLARTELDTVRFATSLDVHAEIKRHMDAWELDMVSYGRQVTEQDIGSIDQAKEYIRRLTQLYRLFVPPLEEYKLSLSEFSYHTRVLWATLGTIGAGVVNDPELDSLRLLYDNLREAYDESRAEGSIPLEEVIGEFQPGELSRARNILKGDPEKVEQAILIMNAELIFMSMKQGPATEEVGFPSSVDWDMPEPEGP